MKAISRRGFLAGAVAAPLAVAVSGLEAAASAPTGGAVSIRWRDCYLGTSLRIGTNPAATGTIRLAMPGGVTRYVPAWK